MKVKTQVKAGAELVAFSGITGDSKTIVGGFKLS
jgi:hypothetical protein